MKNLNKNLNKISTWVVYGLHVSGITLIKKLNDFTRLMMRSIWTLAVATCLVAIDASAETLFFIMTGRAISTVLWRAKESCMLRPLSAITASPDCNFSRKPLASQSPCHWYCHCIIKTKSWHAKREILK